MHAGEYNFNNFTPVVKAMNLYLYVDKITTNPNKFPEYIFTEKQINDKTVLIVQCREDSLINLVRKHTYQIYMLCWTANEINLNKEPYRKNERLGKQLKAIELCGEHLAEVQLCKSRFHLTYKRMKHWGNMTLEVRDSIQAWHKSDRDRYKNI